MIYFVLNYTVNMFYLKWTLYESVTVDLVKGVPVRHHATNYQTGKERDEISDIFSSAGGTDVKVAAAQQAELSKCPSVLKSPAKYQGPQKNNVANFIALFAVLGRVVQKPVNGNPGLKVDRRVDFSFIKIFFTSFFV